MKFFKIKSSDMPTKPKPTEQLPSNLMYVWDPNANDWIILQKDTNKATPPLYDPNNQNVVNQTTSYMSTLKSSCLSKFLDGPQFSKEIKIEAGLIKEGLLKYAGFDFNRGTKYAITSKGLEVLRKASEAEHNEALNEREKLAYMFGFNTDEVSTLDTTGKVIKQSDRKWTICEADGTELGEVVADSELDAKVKFGIEHPEYADSLSISAKEICANEDLHINDYVKVVMPDNPYWNNFEGKITFIEGNDDFSTVVVENEDGKSNMFDKKSLIKVNKNINAQYEQTTESHEPYPNPSETPHNDIVLENHDGWVNTAEQKVTPEFAKLHSILGEYKKNGHILSITQDGKDLLVSCSPIASYEMKQKIEQLGYECEETNESETGDAYDLPSYTLRIKMK